MEKKAIIRKPWTIQDREIVIKCVEEYPVNLSYAFKMASPKLNRSVQTICAYYYDSIKNREKVITTGSNKGFSNNNIKNQHKCKKTGIVIADLQPIQYIIKELLNLSQKERKFLITFLTDPTKLLV